MAFSADSSTLATASDDGTVGLWSTTSSPPALATPGQTYIWAVAYSPDGRVVATGSADRAVRLWDPVSGTVRRTLTGHTDTAADLAFSPDGRMLASASFDGTVRVWDVATRVTAPRAPGPRGVRTRGGVLAGREAARLGRLRREGGDLGCDERSASHRAASLRATGQAGDVLTRRHPARERGGGPRGQPVANRRLDGSRQGRPSGRGRRRLRLLPRRPLPWRRRQPRWGVGVVARRLELVAGHEVGRPADQPGGVLGGRQDPRSPPATTAVSCSGTGSGGRRRAHHRDVPERGGAGRLARRSDSSWSATRRPPGCTRSEQRRAQAPALLLEAASAAAGGTLDGFTLGPRRLGGEPKK